MGRLSYLIQVAQFYHKDAKKKEAEGSGIYRCKNQADIRKDRRCYVPGFEDGGKGHEPSNASGL